MKLRIAILSLVILSACSSDQANRENAMGQGAEPIPETNLLQFE